MKRKALKVVQAIAVLAVLVFVFSPASTAIGAIVCVASAAVFIGCSLIAGHFDEKQTGYWPEESTGWQEHSKNQENDKS